ncbi:MAG: epoxyqueuosine reductase [Candidatus Helarchaeota archaeon]|nr:epoxyqueuosine reductase [Candidatus Helarchaeota archaeon]
MTEKIKKYIHNLDMDAIGIAEAENKLFLEAPENHRPKNILEDAKSVIVFGKTLPRAIFKMNYHQEQLVHRLYHSVYKFLDIAATRLSDYIESLGYYAIPIPSYIPLRIENLEPWGIISLKHAALAAGLGRIAKNGLLIHPKYGTLIRLSAVITTAKLIPDKPYEEEICLDCNLCIENCPAKAFGKKTGKFNKIKCLNNVVKHGLNILHPYDQNYVKNIELITNTLLIEYTVGCAKCLEVCPLNKAPLTKT